MKVGRLALLPSDRRHCIADASAILHVPARDCRSRAQFRKDREIVLEVMKQEAPPISESKIRRRESPLSRVAKPVR